jgi:hypothetical protein
MHKVNLNIIKDPVPTLQKTQLVSITKINWLMLLTTIVAAYSENCMKSINIFSVLPLLRNESNDGCEPLTSDGWYDNVLFGQGYGTPQLVALDNYELMVE